MALLTSENKAERKQGVKQLRAALSTNSALATIAIADATGRLLMDAKTFKDAALSGKAWADRADLNNFVETADADEIEAVSREFGIEDWSKLTIDELHAKIADYKASGKADAYIKQMQLMKAAKEVSSESAKPLPHIMRKNLSDGIYRYSAEGVNMALIKEGEVYGFYDYDRGRISRPLSVKEVNQQLKRYWTGDAKSATELANSVDTAKQKNTVSSTENVQDTDMRYAQQDSASNDNQNEKVLTFLTDEDFDDYISTGKTKHTRDKKQRMLENGKNPILTSEAEIKEFISNVIHGKAVGEVRAFARVPKRLADAISEVRDTLDLEGKYIELQADAIREAYKEHSLPKQEGDIALSESDFENLYRHVLKFDGVLSVNTHNGKTEVHIYRRADKGYYQIVTVSSSERQSLQITKLVGVSKEKFERKYAKKIERNTGSPRMQEASTPSTKARHTAGALSNNIISDSAENSNSSDEKTSKHEKLKKQNEEAAELAKKVKGYSSLNAKNQGVIRAIIRQGRAAGMSESFVLSCARVSARSGLNVVFSRKLCFVKAEGKYADGALDMRRNRIIINPEAKSRSGEMILLHELAHAIYVKDGVVTTAEGLQYFSENEKVQIRKRYAKVANGDATVYADEINAHFIERTLSNKNILERLLADKPTLKDKILDFFSGASTEYADDARLSGASKKLYKQYKKLFDEFAESNQGRNAYGDALSDASSERFVLPIEGQLVDASTVTEQEVRTLLENAFNKQYRDGTYIPVRVNTPSILIEAAQSLGKTIDDLPIILNVGKARQMMSSQREWALEQKRGTAHDFTVDDVISLIRAMDDPKQIVYQSADERYVEVVEFETAEKTKAVAVLEIGENKNPEYLNGYNGGFYQVLVTAFEPDTGYVETLLGKDGNIRIYPKKKKGSSQRGSGNKVPSHLNESPFANRIAETEPEVKSSDETSSDGKRFALDVDSEGTQLTEAQQEFFRDSKVRDSEGRLLVVYHGTPDGKFYEFSYDKAGTVGGSQHGYGFYFSDSERDAKLYTQGTGTIIRAHLNITNPIDATAKDLSSDVSAIFDRLPMYAKSNLREQYGDLETAKRQFAKWDNGTMLSILCRDTEMHPQVFNTILLNLGYDGIVYAEDGYATEYVAFKSSQAKATTNKTPTQNPDIRYALSETRDSIMTEVDQGYKSTAQDKVFSGWTATQIAFTNAQAGIEAVGKKYGVKNIEALVQAARSGRNQAEEMIAGNQYRIGSDSKSYQGEGLEPILRPIYTQGEEVKKDFFDYLFNYLNVDRMSLEQRSISRQAYAYVSFSPNIMHTMNIYA